MSGELPYNNSATRQFGMLYAEKIVRIFNEASEAYKNRDMKKAEEGFRFALSYIESGINGMLDTIEKDEPDNTEEVQKLRKMFIPFIANCMNGLGQVLFASERFDEAIVLFAQLLDIEQRELGSDDKKTITAMHNLASALQSAGRLQQAEPLYREALNKRRDILGVYDKDTLNSIKSLAVLLTKMEQFDEAEALFAEELLVEENTLDDDDPQIQQTRENLEIVRERKIVQLAAARLREVAADRVRAAAAAEEAKVLAKARKVAEAAEAEAMAAELIKEQEKEEAAAAAAELRRAAKKSAKNAKKAAAAAPKRSPNPEDWEGGRRTRKRGSAKKSTRKHRKV